MAIVHKYDAAANDSSKDFVVPSGKTWRFDWAHIILVSTATVGNRQIKVSVYDDSNVLRMDLHAVTTQAASLTRHYVYLPGVYRETSFINDEIQVAVPQNIILLPGWYIRVADSTAVDAAADDMTVSMQITEHSL
jgi:hypothetical protein